MPELIPFPKRPFSSVFRLVPNSKINTSKVNNASEILDLEGAYWEAEFEFRNIKEEDALGLEGFLAAQRGSVGKFLAYDFRREQLDKDFTANVNGANQDGNTLDISGLTPLQTLAKIGERFQLGDGANAELKMLTKHVTSDDSGNATIEFESPVRKIPATNTPLYFKQPKGLFRLANNKQGLSDAQSKNGLVTSWRIKLREAF